MPSPCEITVSQLSRLVGTPDAPVLVDLRIDADFADDPRLVPGAFRHAHHDLPSLVPRLRGRRAVVYCQKGRKISQGAAAVLRSDGVPCEVLEGGQFAWRDAGAPMVAADAVPVADVEGRTVWVTRHRPKIDRIACPWLVRRFVDPRARVLYVPPVDVALVAERFGAVPFDVEGLGLTHEGDRCSFDAFLSRFGLSDPALDRVATAVRAADTNRHDLSPEAAGLLALSLGLSRMHRDDLAMLDAGMTLCDALYRWARDATDEGHDWPTGVARAR
ncbi:chromate resistance protein ChrB domain-containing protein [Jannaschia sp. LMIT008]|uniref:chromate resistance protein ChrB domain-containing protein n=1 Tax=Jannaschia maritima TaxID=3032585 RepID=UPI0028123659|nr:chromate resistance protein ChrB domain-containing protein [Jannaschia sp. LMIT008]